MLRAIALIVFVAATTAAQERPAATGEPAATQPAATQPANEGCAPTYRYELPLPRPGAHQPRFVCEQREILADPVWPPKRLGFTYEIANEGDADLLIRLRGG